MRFACCAAVVALLVPACQYQVPSEAVVAGGPFAGSIAFIGAPANWAVTASFTEAPPAGPADDGCPGTRAGNCCSYSQPAIDVGSGGSAPVAVSAGTIGVDDGTSSMGALRFEGFGYAPLTSAEVAALAWNPGDLLAVEADGGLVGSFAGSIAAPPAFAGVTPELTLESQVVIRLAQGFSAAWTPSALDGGESVTLSLFDPSGFYVDCTVPDSAGTVTAPASALSNFLSGDNGYVTLIRSSRVQLQSASAAVTLNAEATAPGLAHFE